MKAFSLSAEQVTAICAALIVDELGVQFARDIDLATGAEWNADTPLFDGGACLSEEEMKAVAARIARFFSHPELAVGIEMQTASAKIGELAKLAHGAISAALLGFSFAPAGGGEEAVHSADQVFADAAAVANLLYGRRRVISLIAPHSLIGFALTVLAPSLLSAPSLDARGMAPGELSRALAFGDAVVATPSLWRYLVTQDVSPPDNAMAVMFGEPLTVELSSAIRKSGFGAQREVYGSTETGLIAWRDSPSDAFTLFDHWRRTDATIARAAPLGAESEIEPMDVFQWESDRRFRLGGRRDGAVQIGAVNVFPERIAALIADHPAIECCTIKASRHANGGDRLVAEITLKNGAVSETLARSIDQWCRTKLRPQERPRVYNYIGAASAKPARRA